MIPNLHQKEQVGNRAIYNYLNSSILRKIGFQTLVATAKTTEKARQQSLAFFVPRAGALLCAYYQCITKFPS